MVRLIRMFRIFRVFKAMRYSKSINMITRVLVRQKDSLIAVCYIAAGYNRRQDYDHDPGDIRRRRHRHAGGYHYSRSYGRADEPERQTVVRIASCP